VTDHIKLVVAIPSAGRIHALCNFSCMDLMLQLAKGIPSRPTEGLSITIATQISSTIHANRERIVEDAIKNEATHLLFIDDDMRFTFDAVNLLFSRRQPVVAVNYVMKKIPTEFVAVGDAGNGEGKRVTTKADSQALQPIIYSGFGLSLFELRAFKATPQPWFLPQWRDGSYTTEDMPCYEALAKAGFPAYLDHDASKFIGHVGDFEYTWQHWKPTKEVTTDAH
jgi:hypothetical protein